MNQEIYEPVCICSSSPDVVHLLQPLPTRTLVRLYWGLYLYVVLVLAFGWLVASPLGPSSPTDPPGAEVYRIAPAFLLPSHDGGTVSLADFADRPVVVHFVVLVCCSYSALEIGWMKAVESAYSSRGVAFLSIALDSPDNYYSPAEFRDIMDFGWTLALDEGGTVQARYDAVETSTYVIDGTGHIRFFDDEVTATSTLRSWLDEVVS